MDLMTIGAFAERTRLSAKALRLYDRLGLLPPARTDPVTGYRFYREDQVDGARLVALLRRLRLDLAAMTDAQVAAVKRFVANGGNLVATGDTSLHDRLAMRARIMLWPTCSAPIGSRARGPIPAIALRSTAARTRSIWIRAWASAPRAKASARSASTPMRA